MEIKNINDKNFKNDWDDFVIANSSPSSFLQSWDFGNFKSENNNSQIFRFGVFENEELICVAQFFKVALPFGKFYLNCPRGFVTKKQNNKTTKQLIELFKNEIKKMNDVVFFRIAPLTQDPSYELLVTSYGFIKPKILKNSIEPKNTLVLNLEKSEDEILKEMHQKTRYNIRLAEHKGITIKQNNKTTKQQLDNFYNLMQETAKRDKINIFSKEYFEKLISESNSILLTAEHENKLLSAIILFKFGNTCTYFYGASSNEKRNLMPNYLIQWEAIKWAKENGFKYYDFWGISKEKEKWSGITKFKQGFVSEKTGKEINYIGAFDFVINKTWYNIFRIGKILKF